MLNAQDETFKLAPAVVGPQVSASESIRPVVDGSIVSQPFVSLVNNGGFNNKNRALIFTTVKNEAGALSFLDINISQADMENCVRPYYRFDQ